MKDNLTDITVVLDRSGSMAGIQDDTIGGFNKFLQSQKDAPGEATFSLHQFDDQYETVVDAKPIKEAKLLDSKTFVPRGWTALLDAVGRSITNTGNRLAKLPEQERAAKVVFVIITDGFENSSKEFTITKVKEMIKLQRETYKWEFVFLGADQDAFKSGTSMGVVGANTMTFAKNAIGTQALYAATADNLTSFRAGTKRDMSYTEKQHKKPKGRWRMKLHPIYPTPGLDHHPMIIFAPCQTASGESFQCRLPNSVIGYLHKVEDSYQFFPNHYYGSHYSGDVLKEIGFKLADLNAPRQTFTD